QTISLPVPAFLLFRQFVSTLIRSQAYDEAKRVCEHLLACDPTDILTMIELSDVYLCTNSHLDKAEQLLKKANEILIRSEKSELQTHFSEAFEPEEEEEEEDDFFKQESSFLERNPKRIKISKRTKVSLFKSF